MFDNTKNQIINLSKQASINRPFDLRKIYEGRNSLVYLINNIFLQQFTSITKSQLFSRTGVYFSKYYPIIYL